MNPLKHGDIIEIDSNLGLKGISAGAYKLKKVNNGFRLIEQKAKENIDIDIQEEEYRAATTRKGGKVHIAFHKITLCNLYVGDNSSEEKVNCKYCLDKERRMKDD